MAGAQGAYSDFSGVLMHVITNKNTTQRYSCDKEALNNNKNNNKKTNKKNGEISVGNRNEHSHDPSHIQ